MIVDCALYRDGARQGGHLDLGDLPPASELGGGTFVWIGLHDPTADEFARVRDAFSLHPLAADEALLSHQRPKLVHYEGSTFVVLATAAYDDEREQVSFGEIQIFIGEGFVVHVRHGDETPLGQVRHDLERSPDLLRCGPAAVLHAIVRAVVDGYDPVAVGLQGDIEEVELAVFSDSASNPVQRIYLLKREVVATTMALAPLVQPLYVLAREEVAFVPERLRPYLRDVQYHLTRLVEQVHTFSDLLTSVLEANLTRVSVKQNEDMRKISAWVAMAAVPTMIAGIYGMNFDSMPELHSEWGYPIVLGLMAAACLFLYTRFRRSGWL